MHQAKSDRVLWGVVVSLVLGSLAAKFLSSWVAQGLFQSGQIQALNILTGAQGFFPIEFYAGVLEDRFFGPFSVVLSGAAFLILGLRFLHLLTGFRLWIYFLAYFLLTKGDTFLFPPYGDSASGPMMEAVWLLHHNFDFHQLSQQPLFIVGGPKAYLFSFYPAAQALMMRLTPSPYVFLIVNHLWTYFLSAGILAMFFSQMAKCWDRQRAFLLSFFLLSLPLMQSQVEQLNMEIPTLFFLMASFYFLAKKDIFKASLCSGLAIFIKIYALFVAPVIFLGGLFLFFFDPQKKGKISVLFSAVLGMSFALLGAWLLCFVINPGGKVDKVGIFQGWPLIRQFPVTYFFIVSVIAYAVAVYRNIAQKTDPWYLALLKLAQDHYYVVMMFLVTACWFALFLQSLWIPPRYTLILLPSLIVVMAATFFSWVRSTRVIQGVLLSLIFVSLLSSYGLVYPSFSIQNYSVAERSLEYRNDLKLHMRLGQRLSDQYSDLTIAAPFNFAQMLAFPELGFVSKKLDVMIYLFPCLYGDVKSFEGIEKMDLRRTLWVGTVTPFMRPPYFPSGPGDLVVETLYKGNKFVVLFFGGHTIDAIYQRGQALMRMLEESGYVHEKSKIYR